PGTGRHTSWARGISGMGPSGASSGRSARSHVARALYKPVLITSMAVMSCPPPAWDMPRPPPAAAVGKLHYVSAPRAASLPQPAQAPLSQKKDVGRETP